MADKHDEITQLEVAFDALKSQPRDAQLRMLEWLTARLASDYSNAMIERQQAVMQRVAASAGASRDE